MYRYILLDVLTILLSIVSGNTVPGLKRFIPPSEEGCTIIWILELDSNHTCSWCELMFDQLMPSLAKDFIPSSIYSETSNNEIFAFDLKGICFINWFMSTKFVQLVEILKSHKLGQYRPNHWFVYINVSWLFLSFFKLFRIVS